MTVQTVEKDQKRQPLWRQIAQTLENDIHERVLRPGDRMPTEWELTTRFGVNRHTVRRALAALSDAGVIRAEQGRGTFVQEGLIDYHITRRTRFSDTIRAQDREPDGQSVETNEIAADQRIARALQIAPGSPVLRILTLRRADMLPVSLTTHMFPQQRFPDIFRTYHETQSVTKALAKAGVADYTRGRTRVSARLPSPEEVRLLAIPKSRPLLITEAINLDMDGTPIEFGIAAFPADRMQLVFEP